MGEGRIGPDCFVAVTAFLLTTGLVRKDSSMVIETVSPSTDSRGCR